MTHVANSVGGHKPPVKHHLYAPRDLPVLDPAIFETDDFAEMLADLRDVALRLAREAMS
jgi:hypothetical protein